MPRKPKRFSYTYRDMARLLGVSEDVVRQDAHRGHLSENDGLEGLVGYLRHRGLIEMKRVLDQGKGDEGDDTAAGS